MDIQKTQEPLPFFDTVNQNSFHSQYGGLWTDLSNAHELTEGKKELEIISEYEAKKLHQFVEEIFRL